MDAAPAVAAAATLVWLGMVLAISFIEAPLKSRALGIGRLVFRALNTCELALAATVLGCFTVKPPTTGSAVAAGLTVVTLLAQVLIVRPRLASRSDAVLGGDDAPRSRAHWAYVGLEIPKVIALLIAGMLLLAT